jgi:hypothetical protein
MRWMWIGLMLACAKASAQEPSAKPELSAYIQGRFIWDEGSRAGADTRGTPQVKDGFGVRRARLKVRYELDWSKLVLQVDAASRGVALRDAEVHLIEPWTGQRLALVVGQFKWPFGFEVRQSSSEREFPERTRAVRAFFAGERDRGAKLHAKVGWLRADVGLFDGNGIDHRGFGGVDNDRHKDLVARTGFDLGRLSGGVSGWYGRTLRPDAAEPSAPGAWFDRNRLGADLQASPALLPIGATTLRAEYIAGRTYFKSGAEAFGVPAAGWYALLAQALGERNTLALRYDRFDPRAGTPDGASSADPSAPASDNSVATLGLAWLHQWNASLRLTLAYEWVLTATPGEAEDPRDNVFTAQLQAKY